MYGWYEQGVYKLSRGGGYSITRSYIALLGGMQRLHIADLIWSSVAQSKHRFFLWLGAQRRLLTRERLVK